MSVYAKEKPEYLEEALNSLINQTMMPNEIVIVKDGKLTPELDKVIDGFVNMPKYGHLFKLVPLSVNVGLGLALNAGIEACSYDLIARADSDDISLSSRFEEQVGYMDQHPGTIILSANIQEFDETMKNELAMKVVPESDTEIKRFIKRRNPFNHMATVYRKSVIQKIGSYEHCMYFEDYYLWCKAVAYGGSFHNIQKPLVNARAGYSMIARRGGLKYVVHICIFQKMAKKIKVFSLFDVTVNVATRLPVALLPKSFRAFLYKFSLRKIRNAL